MMKLTPTWTKTAPTKEGWYFVSICFVNIPHMVLIQRDELTGKLFTSVGTLPYTEWSCWWSEEEIVIDCPPLTESEIQALANPPTKKK